MPILKLSQNIMRNTIDSNQVYYNIFQDWKANKGNTTSRIVMVLFRTAKWSRSKPILIILFFWYLIIYRVFIQWLSGVHISLGVIIGSGFKLEVIRGTIIDSGTSFGTNCTLRQLTTIGNKKLFDNIYSLSPKIGNNVDIGVNAIIIGEVEIGNNVIIEAGAVITKNVSDNSVMVGNPARLLKKVYEYPTPVAQEKTTYEFEPTINFLNRT